MRRICVPATNPSTGEFPWCHDVDTGQDVSPVRPVPVPPTQAGSTGRFLGMPWWAWALVLIGVGLLIGVLIRD